MEDTLYRKLYKRFKQSNGISTDTRTIAEGEVFLALKGPNFNASLFIEQALSKGASMAVTDEPELQLNEDERVLVVDDTLRALQWLATQYRKEFDIPVIGLTGSNGKTTTKELTLAVLKSRFKAFATPGNLNNHIGVPMSILKMPKDTDIAVIEMGANHIGEIAELCSICQPTHGIITNVGKDHLEGFGSFEGSLRANSELFQYLIENNGTAFINSSDPILMNMSKRFTEPILYPEMGDYSHIVFKRADPFIEYESESGEDIKTQLIGRYNFNNIATAICIGKYFSVPESRANAAVAAYQPLNNRSEWRKSPSNSILLDAYNANPSSMEVALDSFDSMDFEKKAVILGDMFELGEYSQEEHSNLGEKLAEMDFDRVILCGQEMKHAADRISNCKYFVDKSSLLDYLKSNKLNGYLVLLKGSRGMAMEECLTYL